MESYTTLWGEMQRRSALPRPSHHDDLFHGMQNKTAAKLLICVWHLWRESERAYSEALVGETSL